ncbi:MAG TPA: hypothetical protein VML36_09200, partial [Nitrospiria bacterium]|nr:hypothetical protein [Nitrospiria bacterium]
YDGTTMTIYCTGLTPESATCGPLAAIAQPTVTIGAAPEGGQTYQNYLSGFVQRASIWSACLSAADVSDFTTNSPLTDPRCVFYTEFLDANPANRVSSRPVTLTGGVSIADLAYPVPSGPSLGAAAPSPRPWHAYPRNTAAPTPSARPAMLKLAASLPAATAGAGVDDPVHEAATREHEGLIAGLQGAHQRSLRALFSRNLDAALRLQGRALPGQVSWATVGSDHVLYYEDVAEGRTEIGRITADAADPTTIWIAAVCTQCVISLFNVLLIGFIGKTVGTAILTALRTSPGIIARVQAVIAVPLTGMSFINVVKALYQGGQLGQVLMTTLAGLSWWSWAFTITSTVVSICALWLSGGAYLAVVVGQLALDLGKLITLIREAPSTTSAAMVTSDAPATMS